LKINYQAGLSSAVNWKLHTDKMETVDSSSDNNSTDSDGTEGSPLFINNPRIFLSARQQIEDENYSTPVRTSLAVRSLTNFNTPLDVTPENLSLRQDPVEKRVLSPNHCLLIGEVGIIDFSLLCLVLNFA
jgi:hypothetical protein